MQFDRKDFEYSQENARVLWRTFISPSAQLPINISGDIKKDIDFKFKGIVGRNIFDTALVEVYTMMQNGAFQRFLHSQAFKEYAQTRGDFSMSMSSAIVPIQDRDDGLGLTQTTSLNIKDYIQSL